MLADWQYLGVCVWLGKLASRQTRALVISIGCRLRRSNASIRGKLGRYKPTPLNLTALHTILVGVEILVTRIAL